MALWTLIHSSLVKHRRSIQAEKYGFSSLGSLFKLERKIFFRTLLTESRTCPPLNLSLANVKGTIVSDSYRPSLTCEPFTGAWRSVAVGDRNLVHLLRFPHPPLCLSLCPCSVPSCHFSTSRLWWNVGVASRAAAKEPRKERTYLSFRETWISGRWGKELGENQTDTSPFLSLAPSALRCFSLVRGLKWHQYTCWITRHISLWLPVKQPSPWAQYWKAFNFLVFHFPHFLSYPTFASLISASPIITF